MFTVLVRLFAIMFFVLAPFLLLIRGSVLVHCSYQTNAWISILCGTILTAILLFIYFTVIFGKMTGKMGSGKGMKRRFILALIMVFGFAFQGLMYISAKNIKQPSLQKEFRQLHPILRLSVSTILIVDRKAIMTDAQRVPEDYNKMGLKTKSNSLHYTQQDGYSYAVDLRTNGRGELRNTLLKLYFNVMGFQTLRHVGTADHLHVSLKNTDKPWAK